ncbi:hypothetical protein KUW18_13810 [Halomonas sp. DP5Y7-2]|uniref:hypothetical protein n=1 Tax=Halomonas sp. DP5Y7-2 TaxID=2859076 RepID=UPI001C99EA6B|nr:hypothetical protein [Halomonas sp. DP5Y7-2]MBY5985168.1 hypothetical protein [Halomonas sp. DP5Y7-2]
MSKYILFFSFFSLSSLPANPALVLGVLATQFVFLNRLLFSPELHYKSTTLLILGFSTICSLSFGWFVSKSNNIADLSNYLSVILYAYSFLMGCALFECIRKYDVHSLRDILSKVYLWLLVFFFIELMTRLLNAKDNPGPWFYDYKYSVFYYDSNFVALALVCLLTLYLYLRDKLQVVFSELPLWLLIAASFSRTGLFLALLIRMVFCFPAKSRSTVTYLIVLAFWSLLTFLFVMENSLIGSVATIDDSFRTKIGFLIDYLTIWKSDTILLNQIFGIGPGVSTSTFGLYVHNIYAALLLEWGVVGFALFSFTLIFMAKSSNGEFAPFLLVPLIGGFSLFVTYMPFFFACWAVVCHISAKKTWFG